MSEYTIAELLLRADAALASASQYLAGPRPKAGDRAQANALVAGAASLYGWKPDAEQMLQALDNAAAAVCADPTCGAGYALAARCIYRLGWEDRDCFAEVALEKARAWARRATELQPDFETGWEALVEVDCYAYEFDTAEKTLGEIFRRFGDRGLYARAAFLYFRLKADVDQALNWGALAWQQEEDEARLFDTLFAMGTVYEDSQRLKHAYDAYRMICEKDPRNAWGQFLWARVTLALGGVNEAKEMIDKAVALSSQPEFAELRATIARKLGSRPIERPAFSPPSVRLRAAPQPLPRSSDRILKTDAAPEAPRLPRKRKKFYG